MAGEDPHEAPDTFAKLIAEHARVRPRRAAMRHKDLGIWRTWSWAEIEENVRAYAAGLQALGLTRGAKIAIVGTNRPALYWSIMAAQTLGAVPVPVYSDAVAEEMVYVLNHAEVTFAAVEDQEQVDKILSLREKVPLLDVVLYDQSRGMRDYDHTRLHAIGSVIERGRKLLADSADIGADLDREIAAGKGDDVSIILYTSGTTGRSKGVMLSSGRSIAAARDTVAFDKLTDQDEVLAYLPLAWAGDHYLNYAQALVAGFCTACPESSDTAQADLKEIGPTFYFAPPRVFENMLTQIMIRMEDAGKLKRRVFHGFLAVANKWGEKILNREPVPLASRLLYGLGEILIYGPLKNVLGLSRVRVAYTAGEAIGPDLFSFYRSIGLNLKQLYGQTEAFLYVTAQPDGEIKADTVGPPAPNVDIKIASDGEVLYRTPGQFLCYYKDVERTAETVTQDGYVKSGDAGFFDAGGHLKIIDRAKDVGKLRSGAVFSPKYLENKLKFFANIKEAVAFGQDRDFVACLLNIDLTAVGSWAERNNIAFSSYQELSQHQRVYEMLRAHVIDVNRSLAADSSLASAQIRRFIILPKELDADDGELTRTQKVRRGFIADRYADLVSALYDGSRRASFSVEVTFEDGRKGNLSAEVEIADVKIAQH